MNGEISLLLRLLAAQLLLQPLLSILARAFGRPLPWKLVLGSLALPWLLLAPWIFSSVLLVPTGVLANQVPGLEPVQRLDPHSLLLNDAVLAFLPWELEVRHALSALRLPFWSDLVDGGSSPWANPQASVLSPVSMLSRLAPIQHHLLFALALKIGIAMQGTWLAARRFGLRWQGATIAALANALCGGLLAWALFAHSAAIAWAPWCVAAAIAIVRRTGRAEIFGTAAAFLLLLLSGQPEVALGTGALAFLAALATARRRRAVRSLGALLVAGALGAGLAAPLVVPFLAAVPDSQRERDLRDPETHAAKAGAASASGGDLLVPSHPRLLLAPLSPWIFGVPYASLPELGVEPIHAWAAYSGLSVLAGVAVLLFTLALPRRAVVLVAFVLLLLGLFAGLPLLVSIWSRLPVLRLLVFTRLLPLCGLCLALLGGLGIDRLFRHPRRGPVLLALALAFGASLALHPSKSVLAVALLFAAGAMLARRAPAWALALLVVALLGDQVRWGRHLLPRGAAGLFYPSTPEIARLQELAGGEGGRVVGHDFLAHPNVLSVYGLSDPRVNDPLTPSRYLDVLGAAFDYRPSARRYFSHFLTPEHPLLDFLGVRAVYSNVNLPPIPGMERIALPDGVFFFARNDGALERWFLATRVDRVADGRLAAWIRDLDDPERVAVAPGAAVPEGDGALVAGTVELLSRRPGSISLALPAAGTKLLATSIPGPRGWRVSEARDARGARGELATLAIDGAFLGALVPDGVGRIDLVYRPPGLAAGLAIGALAAAALALVALRPEWIAAWLGRRRAAARSVPTPARAR